VPAITLTAGISGGSVGYARSGSSAYSAFGSISAQPLAGYTLDYIDAAAGSGFYVVGFVGNTVGSLPISSFTVNGNVWNLGSGTYQSAFGSTQYPITITTGAGFANGVAYTVDMSGDPVITSPNTNTNAIGTTLAHALTANESVSWSIIGGADQALFEISGSTLRWVSNGVSGSTGAKVVQVRATAADNGATVDQTITVTVYIPYVGPTVVGTVAATGGAAGFNLNFGSSGRAAGDKLAILVMTANQLMATPSGFATGPSSPQVRGSSGAAGGVAAYEFEKTSDGTEGNIAIADSGDIQWACGLVIRGAGGAGVAVDVSTGNNVAATTSGSFGGVTTTGDDRLIVHYVTTDRDATTSTNWGTPTNANLGNLTERIDSGTATGTGGGVAIITGEKQAAGATGNTTSTQGASAAYCWITVAYQNATSGSQTLTPSLFTNSQAFYGPTITRGAVTLAPSLLTNAQSFYAPTVALTQALAPSLLTNSQSFYAPTVTRGAVSLAPSLFTNTQTFYAATVSRGSVALSPSLLTNSQSFPAATVTATYTLAPALLTNTQTFYGPTASPGAVTLAPTQLSNAQSFHAPTVTQSALVLSPSLVVNAQSFFSPTVASSNAVSPPLISNAQSFYAPTVSSRKTLTPPLYANDNSFFPATVSLANQVIRPDLFVNGVSQPDWRMWRPFMGSFAA